MLWKLPLPAPPAAPPGVREHMRWYLLPGGGLGGGRGEQVTEEDGGVDGPASEPVSCGAGDEDGPLGIAPGSRSTHASFSTWPPPLLLPLLLLLLLLLHASAAAGAPPACCGCSRASRQEEERDTRMDSGFVRAPVPVPRWRLGGPPPAAAAS